MRDATAGQPAPALPVGPDIQLLVFCEALAALPTAQWLVVCHYHDENARSVKLAARFARLQDYAKLYAPKEFDRAVAIPAAAAFRIVMKRLQSLPEDVVTPAGPYPLRRVATRAASDSWCAVSRQPWLMMSAEGRRALKAVLAPFEDILGDAFPSIQAP